MTSKHYFSYLDSEIQHGIEEQFIVILKFKIGTMTETFRACNRSENLAEITEFFLGPTT